jgi:orotate phosphoribosyltransferase
MIGFQAPSRAHQDRQMSEFRKEFIAFCIDCVVLRFGRFKTKAGRRSPYFFNAGLFNDGAMLGRPGQFYAKAILAAGQPFDMLFGPAYKGIPLAASVAIALDRLERGAGERSAVQEVREHFGLPVIAIADLDDLMQFLDAKPDLAQQLIEIERYRQLYGATAHA